MSYRSPLAKARGLGSAKEGVHHWWMQRLTAIALVPLLVWFVVCLALLGQADYETLSAWVAQPQTAIPLIILVLALFYHSSLGIQVVVEDYVGTEWMKIALIVTVNFANIVLVVISIFAILKIVFGTGA
jgi:succinate dehydrogenase / fumarate reductase membrane anchor subunit